MVKKRNAGSQLRIMGLTDNFWEDGKYRRVVRRIEEGSQLCEDFARLTQERGFIEKKYAAMLRAWSQRWEQRIEKGSEYPDGTMRNAWRALLDEADGVANVHQNVGTRLSKEVKAVVLKWRKENFTKTLLSIKEVKKAEESFSKAQEPWNYLQTKSTKAKKKYYSRCRAEKALSAKVRDAERSGSITQEELNKLKAKWDEAKTDMEKARRGYEGSLKALEADLPRYERDMKAQFEACQDNEQKRLDFFKKMMLVYHTIVEKNYANVWDELKDNLAEINSDADLVKYAERHGTGMPLVLPKFAEFGTPEAEEGAGSNAAAQNRGPGIHIISSPVRQPNTTAPRGGNSGDDEEVSEDDWEEDNSRMAPPPSESDVPVGLTVRALYDYDAEEEGEINLKAGDILTQLEDEDEQGWCRGLLPNGEVGLYPAAYVEVVGDD